MAKSHFDSVGSLPSVFNFKTLATSIALAVILNQTLHHFQGNSTKLRLSNDIISKQRDTIAGLSADYESLLESTEIIAFGFEKLWGETKDLIEKPQKFDDMDEHLLSYFGVEPTHFIVVDPAIRKYIEAHDIRNDAYYKDDPEEMERRVLKYGTTIERGSTFDRRYYTKYVDSIHGYGLFANTNINKGDILGAYTGYLTNQSYTTDYTWTYQSRITDESGNEIVLGLDGKEIGNWFRFVNSGAPESLNVEAHYVPYYLDHRNKGSHYNVWNVVYVAARAIKKDDELLVSYGESYWETRQYTSENVLEDESSTIYAEALKRVKLLNEDGIL